MLPVPVEISAFVPAGTVTVSEPETAGATVIFEAPGALMMDCAPNVKALVEIFKAAPDRMLSAAPAPITTEAPVAEATKATVPPALGSNT